MSTKIKLKNYWLWKTFFITVCFSLLLTLPNLVFAGGKNSYVKNRKELTAAIEKGKLRKVQQLLDDTLNIEDESVNYSESTPLLEAVYYGQEEIVEFLLKAGANLNACDMYGHGVLVKAIGVWNIDEHIKVKIVQRLLAHGIDVNERRSNKDTALTTACRHGLGRVVDVLLKAGAEIETKDLGDTPLMVACKNKPSFSAVKEYNAVQVLLEAGAAIEAKGSEGRTSLMLAAYANNLEAVKILLQFKADINVLDKNGCDAFRLAVEKGSVSIAKLVFQEKSVDKIDHLGCTPLLVATLRGSLEMVEFLLKAGSEINFQTQKVLNVETKNQSDWNLPSFTYLPGKIDQFSAGVTALTLAKKYNHTKIERALVKAGALDLYAY